MVWCEGRATWVRWRWSALLVLCLSLSVCAAGVSAQETVQADVTHTAVAASGEKPKEPVIAGPQHAPDWQFRLTPYFWLASIGLNTGRITSLDIDVGDVAQLLRGAFMANTEIQYKDFGLVVDYIYVKLRQTRDLGQGDAGRTQVDATTNILDMRATYRVFDSRRRSAPLGAPTENGEKSDSVGTQLMLDMGARYFRLNSSLQVDIPALLPNGQGVNRKFDGENQWWDWIVGGHVHTTVTSRVGLGLSANLGGFNIGNSSRFTWEVTTGVLFRLWKGLQLDIGYRALQAVRQGSDLKGDLKNRRITMSGLLVGLGVAF